MPERFEVYIVYKWCYINTFPFLSFPFLCMFSQFVLNDYSINSTGGVFPSLDRVSGTLCLLHYMTETSHLYSLGDF